MEFTVAGICQTVGELYKSSTPESQQLANQRLLDFQKTPQAWSIADNILNNSAISPEIKIFAAQTLRQKITYDLSELDTNARISLRDSLLNLLNTYCNGPKAITTQVCLSLAGLALQVTEWDNVLNHMIQLFGSKSESVGCLIEFLSVLPDEINNNDRIVMDMEVYRERSKTLLTDNAPLVVGALGQYMQQSDLKADVRRSILECFRSWLKSGDITAESLDQSPLMGMAFQSLQIDDLFETAVDVICCIVFESKDNSTSTQTIEREIYPRLLEVRQLMQVKRSEMDDEMARGFCRIFTEACESYLYLLTRNAPVFEPLLQGLLECMTYPDLEIVPMTFNFWDQLAEYLNLPGQRAVKPHYGPLFATLVDIIMTHLRYPSEQATWTAEQQDQFRSFRHQMGDVLKACVTVIGDEAALARPYQVLEAAVPNQGGAPTSNDAWQTIEAALFTLRAMGAEIPRESDGFMPKIMALLPRLPSQPKIRYAATLVISRYTFWTHAHPDLIPFQLDFICNGLKDPDVAAAAAMALRFLCRDCAEWLFQFLPQLHQLYTALVPVAHHQDARELTEGVAHVVASLPADQILGGLQPFCEPFLVRLAALADRNGGLDNSERQELGYILERVTLFFRIAGEKGNGAPLNDLLGQVWTYVQKVATVYHADNQLSEMICQFMHCCVGPFAAYFVSQLGPLAELLVHCFSNSGLSCYLWVAKNCVRRYSLPGDQIPVLLNLLTHLGQAYFNMANSRNLADVPDVVEDFNCLLVACLHEFPSRIFESPWFGPLLALQIPLLAIQERYALGAMFKMHLLCLDLAVNNFPNPHESPSNAHHHRHQDSNHLTAAAVNQVVAAYRNNGPGLTRALMSGILEQFNPSFVGDAATALTYLFELMPTEAPGWLADIISTVPDHAYPGASKQSFLAAVTNIVQNRTWANLPRRLRDLSAFYRRRNHLGGLATE
ncbi:Nuclear import receptor [Dimargaris cristalligena]|uniref:Armadillo-type protein n=1 Tax=Dimargaris cristalligena TaxID=215637 RepID=A0A4P9ZZS4_9FUNG|nr:Nuclear import receptor [Dimargaris cristalligena]RKP39296.1 armadillo-type protein [Dimargaris cristalligena]|eukprot:RKP39296.1 armadillo-type protein [Dimargaris cristalligena]